MKFNVYGRFIIEIQRENESWITYRAELGKRRRVDSFVVPAELSAEDLATYLDDLYHELAQPGQRIEVCPDRLLRLEVRTAAVS